MASAARGAGVVPRRIHLTLAIDRLLVRLLDAAPGRWVVKGGYANQLRRPDDARFTEDLDLRIEAAIETAPELLALRVRRRSDRRLQLRGCRVPGTAGGPTRRRSPVRGGRTPCGHRARPVQGRCQCRRRRRRRLASYFSDPVVERLGFRRSRFPVYPVDQHFAEKLHALTLPRDVENTRARDLVDLVWFIRRFTFRSDALAIACIATFDRRATHPWPPVIDVPPDSWTRPYGVWRAELDLAEPTPAAAASALRSFLEPVYYGTAGWSWDPAAQEWR